MSTARKSTSSDARQIALLRGINVGKNKRIAMADLRRLLTDAGFSDVVTLLQSGNIVFTGAGSGAGSDTSSDATNARRIERAIAEKYGFDVDVIVRSTAELAAAITANPLKDAEADGSKFLMIFLPTKLPAGSLDAVPADDFAPELFATADGARELYLYCPEAIHSSKLYKALIKQQKLVGAGTARNWNTVTKLLELASDR